MINLNYSMLVLLFYTTDSLVFEEIIVTIKIMRFCVIILFFQTFVNTFHNKMKIFTNNFNGNLFFIFLPSFSWNFIVHNVSITTFTLIFIWNRYHRISRFFENSFEVVIFHFWWQNFILSFRVRQGLFLSLLSSTNLVFIISTFRFSWKK